MSYRSDVALVLTEDSFCYSDFESEQIKKLLGESIHVKSDDGDHLFLWNCIMWYDEDADISALMAVLTKLNNESYLFLRIGESMTDTVENGCYYENAFGVGIARQISYDDSVGERV